MRRLRQLQGELRIATGVAMPDRAVCIEDAGPGKWAVLVWVQPGAKKNGLAGLVDGRLKVRLNAPAVDNKANRALEKYVASLLGLRASRVTVASGMMSRRKKIFVETDAEPDWSLLLAVMEEHNL